MAEGKKIVLPIIVPLIVIAVFACTWYFRGKQKDKQIDQVITECQVVVDSLHTINIGLVKLNTDTVNYYQSLLNKLGKDLITSQKEIISLRDEINNISPYKVTIEYQPWVLDSLAVIYWPDSVDVEVN